MASRIGVIHEGNLLQVGTPREIYENPNSLYVASRLGSPQINLIPAKLIYETAAIGAQIPSAFAPNISSSRILSAQFALVKSVESSISAIRTMCISTIAAKRSSPLRIRTSRSPRVKRSGSPLSIRSISTPRDGASASKPPQGDPHDVSIRFL